MSTFTRTLDGLDAATRAVIARDVVSAAERAASDRARRIAARTLRTSTEVCDPDDFDAHVAGFASDGAPEFGRCVENCTVIA